ncbi:helix-turn-helix domain-containing protein [Gemmata sp. JC717]|uniref:helix-turn-helix domain-containing protein n=1 Tax=Gemmata algarum TaxID=2975278 RepID=UPI0021BA7F76|nr:helix-turn-helix domain-containing protein [Gemmata algarum]MDY3555048.1 helix-turn-helix domain-containing protein [Gemmata algarum]
MNDRDEHRPPPPAESEEALRAYLLEDRRRHDFIDRRLPFTLVEERTCEPVRYELGDDWLDLMVLFEPGYGWEVHVLDRSSDDLDLIDVEMDLKDRHRAALAVPVLTTAPPVAAHLTETVRDILARLERLENQPTGPDALAAVESPYLTAEEAAAYLRVNVNALYSLVERRKLAPLPGHRKYRFTRAMLDAYLKGE